MVIFNDTDKNPTGVNKKCRDYALEHGHMNYTTIQVPNEVTGELVDKNIIDPLNPYTQDDPDEYRIIILDNAANLTVEKGCKDLKDTIEKMSKYNIILRKQLNYIVVFIQHQMQSQESLENIKMDMTKPSATGLGDAKTTVRDLNCLIGLYSPAKFGKKTYLGYNIERLKDHCRFLEILDDRDYGANGNICPLFFDGATSTFKELPLVTDKDELEKYYRYAEFLDSRES
jgi:hypothetical protein